jgi:hypothetical protein
MRMLILLGVFGTAGSLLLAAESPSTPKPASAAKQAEGETPQADEKPAAAADKKSEDPGKGKAKTDSKDAAGKGSIAEQAEAALKAAAEAEPGSTAPKEPPKDEEQQAKDEPQGPPGGSSGKGPSPQRFVPSEQVRADFDVSFPIDI